MLCWYFFFFLLLHLTSIVRTKKECWTAHVNLLYLFQFKSVHGFRDNKQNITVLFFFFPSLSLSLSLDNHSSLNQGIHSADYSYILIARKSAGQKRKKKEKYIAINKYKSKTRRKMRVNRSSLYIKIQMDCYHKNNKKQ